MSCILFPCLRRCLWSTRLELLAAPLIVPFEFPKNIQMGMRVRLLCSIMQGDPPFTFSWLKDGKALDPSPLSLGVRSDDFSMDLTFARVTPRHNGNYTCLASNDAATVSHSALLVVDGKCCLLVACLLMFACNHRLLFILPSSDSFLRAFC